VQIIISLASAGLVTLLQLKSQSVKTKEEPCIGLTQENLLEFLVQMCLPYIP